MAQVAFLVGLATAGAAIALVTVVIVAADRRSVGGGAIGLLERLSRPSTARMEVGRWAHVAHRVSGLSIFAFLALHLGDIALFAVSPGLYDEVHSLYGTAPLRVFEVVLLAGILFHALNGLRLVALDLTDVSGRAAERWLWVVLVATVGVTIPAATVILGPVLR
jgi:succinate dehydrogenase / fumarate reductase cytochrome b subunit